MLRVLSYCYNFIQKARKQSITYGPISCRESNNVLHKCIQLTQRSQWPQLSRQTVKAEEVITPSTLAQLAPFIDLTEIIRVGDRLKSSTLDENAKHPVLLPKKTILTRLVILHYHQCLLHSG